MLLTCTFLLIPLNVLCLRHKLDNNNLEKKLDHLAKMKEKRVQNISVSFEVRNFT